MWGAIGASGHIFGFHNTDEFITASVPRIILITKLSTSTMATDTSPFKARLISLQVISSNCFFVSAESMLLVPFSSLSAACTKRPNTTSFVSHPFAGTSLTGSNFFFIWSMVVRTQNNLFRRSYIFSNTHRFLHLLQHLHVLAKAANQSTFHCL